MKIRIFAVLLIIIGMGYLKYRICQNPEIEARDASCYIENKYIYKYFK